MILNKFISSLNTEKSIPTYYQLSEGWVGKVCTWNDARINQLDRTMAQSHIIITRLLALAILGIPALIGLASNAIIYRVKGEKIKKEDYQAEFNGWLQKPFIGRDDILMKKFVDFCIKNRIYAKDCPHDDIIHVDYSQGPDWNIIDMDGCAPNQLTKLDKKQALILCDWSTKSECGYQQILSDLNVNNLKDFHPFTQDFRNWYKTFQWQSRVVKSGIIDRCHFVVFDRWTVANNPTLSSIQNAFTSTAKA